MMRTALFIALVIPSLAFAAAEKQQGLSVSFTAGGKTDTTTSRLAALFVPKGTPATPFLPKGPFTAKFTGDLAVPLRGDYKFMVDVRGLVKVSINGEEVFAATSESAEKTLELKKGANAVLVEFSSNGEDDAVLRLDWATEEFPREPVSPMVLSHVADEQAAKVREGRMLFATRHCSACHDGGAAIVKDGTGMPELLATAPDLINAGARFKQPWLAAWIENPRSIRPSATMPHLPLTKAQAADIAAYVATLGAAAKSEGKPADDALISKGAAHFGNLGCVACHTAPDIAETDTENRRISLAHVAAKFQSGTLAEFLKMPGMHNPWTRMPNFRLTDAEATELSAYVLAKAKAEFPEVKGDAVSGKKLFAANCVACHQTGEPAVAPKASALAAVIAAGEKGCLAEKPGNAPDFGFTAAQRASVSAFLKTDLLSLKQDTFADFAERQIHYMNCVACHPRDGQQSTFHIVEGELSALVQGVQHPEENTVPVTAIPHLTWLGEKLNTGWSGIFIAGAAPYKPRPWLGSRMPGFGAPGIGIANGLAFQHGLPLSDPPQAAPEKETVDFGKTLLGADGGFNCVQCHAVKDTAATAVFEAPGINLAYTTERLRSGYYHRWMLAPLRIDPDSKMPKFSDDGVRTQIGDILEGSAPAQFDAIWHYLRTVK